MVGFIILTLVLSAFIGWITIPNIIIISKRKRLFDSHNSRKVHTGAIPRLGGISFLPAVLVSFCLSLGIRHVTDGFDLNPLYVDEFYAEFLFFVAGLISLFFIGLADDLVGIGYKSKFLVQVVAAAMLVLADLNIKSFDGLFGIYYIHPVFSVLLTVFVVVGAVNAYNLLFKKPLEEVRVNIPFGEYANPSFESQVETISKGKQGGIMSIEAAVEELYGDSKDEKWKMDEIARLKAEQGIQELEEPSVSLDGLVTEPEQPAISMLNGAQIASLMNVIKMVKEGSVTRNEAISIITATLGISRENAESFIEEGISNESQSSESNVSDEPQ